MEQMKIVITCDKGHVADFLRELASAYEESPEDDMVYETAHGIAEITEDTDYETYKQLLLGAS